MNIVISNMPLCRLVYAAPPARAARIWSRIALLDSAQNFLSDRAFAIRFRDAGDIDTARDCAKRAREEWEKIKAWVTR